VLAQTAALWYCDLLLLLLRLLLRLLLLALTCRQVLSSSYCLLLCRHGHCGRHIDQQLPGADPCCTASTCTLPRLTSSATAVSLRTSTATMPSLLPLMPAIQAQHVAAVTPRAHPVADVAQATRRRESEHAQQCTGRPGKHTAWPLTELLSIPNRLLAGALTPSIPSSTRCK